MERPIIITISDELSGTSKQKKFMGCSGYHRLAVFVCDEFGLKCDDSFVLRRLRGNKIYPQCLEYMEESGHPTLEEMDIRSNDYFIIQHLDNKPLIKDRNSECDEKLLTKQADKILQTKETNNAYMYVPINYNKVIESIFRNENEEEEAQGYVEERIFSTRSIGVQSVAKPTVLYPPVNPPPPPPPPPVKDPPSAKT